MRKSIEMKKKLDALKNDIATLQASGEIAAAHAKLADLTAIKNAIEVQEALEAEEDNGFTGTPAAPTAVANDKIMRNRVFTKLVLGRRLDDAEKGIAVAMAAGTPGQVEATDAKGGYLVPVEQLPRLEEYRRGLLALREQCELIPANSKSGNFPTVTDGTDTLTNFDELNAITQSDIDFGQCAYSIADYGDIIPVSNSLLEDTDVDLVSVIGRRFALKATRTENAKIFTKLALLNATAGTTYDDLKKAINVTLDSAYKDGAVILTNQDGYHYLDTVKTTDGKPLLQPMISDASKMTFAGHEIIVASNAQLATASGAIPFYVGSLFDYLKFFERKGVTIAVSTEAGFTKNATMLRAIERFDVQVGDSSAVVKVAITPAA